MSGRTSAHLLMGLSYFSVGTSYLLFMAGSESHQNLLFMHQVRSILCFSADQSIEIHPKFKTMLVDSGLLLFSSLHNAIVLVMLIF